jgi:hypothetical protein
LIVVLKIIAREDIQASIVKVMYNGYKKLMSRGGKLKGEDLFNLK